MRRDIGNEVVFAIAAVAVMVFAVTFAIVLSLSSSEEPVAPKTATEPAIGTSATGDKTPVAISPGAGTSVVQVSTEALSNTLTRTFARLTVIPESATPIPSDTPSQAATATPARTSTATPSQTVTPTATAVDTVKTTVAEQQATTSVAIVQASTATSHPTVTPTGVPTETSTATPTHTATNTLTPTSTDTPTRTLTPTAALTHTSTPSVTSTGTAANTVIPVNELGILPTPTGVSAATPTVAARGNCEMPKGWQVYTVQPGNTMFSIARAVGSTVSELSAANCLVNANLITTGDQLFVPNLPAFPVQTGVPRAGSSATPSNLSPVGCTDPSAQITSPLPGQHMTGSFSLLGTASLDDFWYYRIEVRPDWATVYNVYGLYEKSVINGFLSSIDSSIFDPGLHWVRVSVINLGGGIPQTAVCAIPVIFEEG